ncbi:MAG: MFS transporter [Chloroflexi bacterium]|nr:MFS transporter [Chloroflexota bacterium]
MGRRFSYGWVILGVAVLGMFTTSTSGASLYTVFIEPLEAEFGWSRTFTSGVITAAALAGGFLSPFGGLLLDRFGIRRVLLAGGVIGVGAGFALSAAQNGWQFYSAFVVLRMVSEGVVALGLMTMVSNWFVAKRGRAMGLTLGGGYVGAGLLPLVAYTLIRVFSWRVAFGFAGMLFIGFLLIPTALFARQGPEEKGLLSDGHAPQPGSPGAAPAAALPVGDESAYTLRQALRLPAFWLLLTILVLVQVVQTGLLVHLVPILKSAGLTSGLAAIVVSLAALMRVGGNVAWGLLAERFSIRLCLLAAIALVTAATAAMYNMSNAPQAIVLVLFWGFNVAGLMTMEWLVYPQYFGRRHFASIRGFAGPFILTGSAIGPIVAGSIYDHTDSYKWAMVFFALCGALAGVVALLLRRPAPRG